LADEDSEEDDEAKAILEERQAVIEAFESVSTTGYITFKQFAQVFEELGSTYCEEILSLFAKRERQV
jgi:predicted ATP-grasp superfamily ATP-dependent carboligase